MDEELTDNRQITAWIAKWQKSGGAERANYQLFLTELCDVLGVPHPDPTRAEEPENSYVFEKNFVFNNHDGTTSTKRVDLYRRGCFVCETKQGVEAEDDEQLLSAKSQEARKKRKAGRKEGILFHPPSGRVGLSGLGRALSLWGRTCQKLLGWVTPILRSETAPNSL